jgi:hypothetical protein
MFEALRVGETEPYARSRSELPMTLLEKVAVVGLSLVYWPVLVMLALTLGGSGRVIAPLEMVGILIFGSALAYVTVRGIPKRRRQRHE